MNTSDSSTSMGKAGTVRFEGRLTPEDVMGAMKLHVRPARPGLIVLLAAVILAVGALVIFTSANDGDEYFWITSGAPMGIFIIFWVVLIWVVIRQGARQATTNAFLLGTIRGEADAERVELGGDEWSTSYPWKMLYRTKMSLDLVLLYQGSNVFNLFPRRFFFSEEDWKSFRNWAESHQSSGHEVQQKKRIRRNLVIFLVLIAVLIFLMSVLRFVSEIHR